MVNTRRVCINGNFRFWCAVGRFKLGFFCIKCGAQHKKTTPHAPQSPYVRHVVGLLQRPSWARTWRLMAVVSRCGVSIFLRLSYMAFFPKWRRHPADWSSYGFRFNDGAPPSIPGPLARVMFGSPFLIHTYMAYTYYIAPRRTRPTSTESN